MDLLFQTLKQWSAVHILTMTKNSWFSTFLRLQRFPSASVSKLGLWPRHAHQFTPRSMETPVLLNGQMPQPSHIQMHIHPHTVQTKRQSWVCVRRRERVHARSSDCYKHRYSKGLLWPQCRQRSSVNWDLFCLPQETITSLFSLCFLSFSLFPFIWTVHGLPLFHRSLPRCTSSPGWPSVTSTPCPEWPNPSGWLWCLEHQRRTSSAVNSWGSFLCWWSRPPRTSWVSPYSSTYFTISQGISIDGTQI